MADPIKDTSNASDPCDLVNANAQVQRTMAQDVRLPGESSFNAVSTVPNGQYEINRGDNTYLTRVIPLFGDVLVSGLVPTAQAAPNALDIAITAGTAQLGNTALSYAGGTVTVGAGDVTEPRIDVLSLDSVGAVNITAGTPAASPTIPSTPADQYKIAEVYVPANATGASTGNAAAYIIWDVTHPDRTSEGRNDGYLARWDAATRRWVEVTPTTTSNPATLNEIATVLQSAGLIIQV